MIFGGYFGDTIPVVVKMATGKEIVLPSLVNPSNDPISVLILSLILGLIHLFAGMGAKAYLLIKRGQIWDAVFDIGFGYLVLGGRNFMFRNDFARYAGDANRYVDGGCGRSWADINARARKEEYFCKANRRNRLAL